MQFCKERKILTAAQLKRLSEHKYSCLSDSILDSLLQPWWCWLVSKTPLWLAPNLITILGLIVNIVTTLILVWYSPDARQDPPRWACALCALGVFVYQSLDAIDGKQARRTNSQSPLGELFDHGCDSLSTVFIALGACIAVKLGEYPTWMFFQCICAMTLFYCAHWQAYVTGTLKMGRIDVTEAQYSIIAIHLISAIIGPGFWSTQMPVLAAPWSLLISSMTYPAQIYLVTKFLATFRMRGCGKNGSTVAGTSILSPVIPFSLVVVPAFVIFQKSESNVYENHPVLYLIAFGMVAAKVTNRLVVAHMTKSEMEYFDWALLGPAMLFLNQYFNNALPEYFVLWLCAIWTSIELFRYCGKICLEICEHMSIQLFRIAGAGSGSSAGSSSSSSAGAGKLERNATSDSEKSETEDTAPLINNNNIS
ncbi:cholinephosphotransferase 1 isoform X6 [Plodia interpunctella]|uniref:cholinephosphotransferase 1 isoform X6 n=1 Tax=Plodia interpunctella TaxID=58824 RepID=UPI002368E40E|nr:cholinephosphotransferase 1 isoform X6 [Plodia interpunctella]